MQRAGQLEEPGRAGQRPVGRLTGVRPTLYRGTGEPRDAHATVILDGAGWHRSQGLVVPGNITLLELPPYSPELNPVERIWHYLRSHWAANSVYTSLADIMDACEAAWNRFATNHGLIHSLCAVAWAPASPAP